MNKKDIILNAIAEIKKTFPNVLGIYLFGSIAKGEATSKSDVDTAEQIDNQNPKQCDAFEDLAWSMYLRFNEERKNLLNDIQKTGRIY